MIVVYVVGLPAAIMTILLRNRSKLWTPEVMHRYGFLYARWVLDCWAC